MTNKNRSLKTKKFPSNLQGFGHPGPTFNLGAFAIIILAFGLRLYTLDSESLWYDELLQLDIAQAPLSELFPRLRGHSAVPLDYLITHFWIMLGRSEAWVRLPAVIIGTLTLPFAYRLGRLGLGYGTALLFMFLLAISPFHIRYSQEVRPYALLVLGGILLVYGFWQLRHTGRRWYFIPLQIGVLILSLAHIFGIAILVSLSIFALGDFIFSQNRKSVFLTFVALVISGLLPLLIFTWMGWIDVLFYSSRGFGEALLQPQALSIGADADLKHEGGPTLDWPFYHHKVLAPFVNSKVSTFSLLFFNGLLALGLLYLLAHKKLNLAFLLLLWLTIPPLLIITFLVFRETFFAPRYIISILPAYLLLLSLGLVAILKGFKQIIPAWAAITLFLMATTLVLTNLIGGLNRYYNQLDKEDWRLVGNFIATNAKPDDVVIAFHAEPTMNWYFPFARADPNYYYQLETIQAAISQAHRSWVILSIFSSDFDAPLKAWLSEQQAIRLALHPMIHVYYLGHNTSPDQLLLEIQGFALPIDHTLYASLARENRHQPDIARQYYKLAIQHAPNAEIRATYQTSLDSLPP